MTAPTSTVETDLEGWLVKQPVWLQYGAHALIKGSVIGPKEIAGFVEMAVSEARGTLAPPNPLPRLGSLGSPAGGAVALQSLSKISGINNLNPRNPLDFGTEKLAVVCRPGNSSGTS